LDLGANDYVEKPFGVGELLARLRVALRQRAPAQGPSGADPGRGGRDRPEKHLVTRDGAVVKVSPREYDVLARLAQARARC
jgi:two-component system KDP operon response regulator KdpE